MQEHKIQSWQLVSDNNGNPNLYHQKRHALFHQDLSTESTHLVNYLSNTLLRMMWSSVKEPATSFGIIYTFPKLLNCKPLIEKILTQQSKLPDQVETLIIFGIGLGQHIELLTQQRQIKNLFLCEPNLDFFAASLWVTDWAAYYYLS